MSDNTCPEQARMERTAKTKENTAKAIELIKAFKRARTVKARREAQGVLILHALPIVRQVCIRLRHSGELGDIEDRAHDVVPGLLRGLHKFDPKRSSWGRWVYQISQQRLSKTRKVGPYDIDTRQWREVSKSDDRSLKMVRLTAGAKAAADSALSAQQVLVTDDDGRQSTPDTPDSTDVREVVCNAEMAQACKLQVDCLRKKLSELELLALAGWLNGEGQTELAIRLGVDVRSIDNARQRVRKKALLYLDPSILLEAK